MKSIVFIIAFIFYLAMVNGRNLHDLKPNDEDSDVDLGKNFNNEHLNSQTRHRRRSRHSYYNHYDPYNYDDRRYDTLRDSRQQQDELLSKILSQIEEISFHIRRPPPPPTQPQIIYVPVPYPIAVNNLCPNKNNITFSTKFGIEKNQNWGQVTGDTGSSYDYEDDGSRPINFNPVLPEDPIVKAPPVEHGTNQAGMSTPRPSTKSQPGRCKAAILVCCQYKQNDERQLCFSEYGCIKTYSVDASCRADVLKRVMQEFAESYAPINNT